MRKAGFVINGKGESGYWAMEKYQVGDFYEMKLSGKLMVIATVFDGKFETAEGEGYFYQLRSATEAEIAEYNSGSSEAEKDLWEEFFHKTETF